MIAATGDHGYIGDGYDAYPAAFPGVTAAGGTSLAPATGGQSARGFGESAWSLDGDWGAGSGCDVERVQARLSARRWAAPDARTRTCPPTPIPTRA